jgi:hypothetical protein
MTAIRAHIKNGAVVLDEPLDLPDGTPVTVNVSNDVDAFSEMGPEERTEFLQALDEAIEDEENGRMDDAIAFADRLLARP